ncbi:hypothetical protein N7478_009630 [Penicillium angulare]|uniref:uncharacterized protein n=1 Tax=Penicillium angulare TaxID=116970 RepID=UPI00254261E2|nr:uncharacterized protein N7478_009630 [Penicillium angulare]KAJ5266822.1 hypothetical protein N7478_009630 [Penicillium angulare]
MGNKKRKIKDSEKQQKKESSDEKPPENKRRKKAKSTPPPGSSAIESKSESKSKSPVKTPTRIKHPREISEESRIGVLGFPVAEKPIPLPQKPMKSLQIKSTTDLLQYPVKEDGRGLHAKVSKDLQTETVTFQPTTSLGPGCWPEIRFGEHGPMPRWTLKESKQDIRNGRDLSIDLIRTHKDRTNIIGVDQYAHPPSGDWKIGLGTLEWKFEPGPPVKWKGLTEAQLYEFAYLCLMDALGDYRSRETIRSKIREMRFRSVRNVQDPLPPPPAPPKVTHFGPNPGITEWPKMPPPVHGAYTRFFNDYWRPTMGLHTDYNRGLLRVKPDPGGASDNHFLTSRMFHHLKGTLGPEPAKISESRDPKASMSPVDSVASSEGSEPRKSSLSKEWDPEKATGHSKHLRAGGVVAMSEYRFLYFFVVILILSMFLCLFLYAFKIIK